MFGQQSVCLQELNSDQLGWFSRTQASALTADQKSELGEEGKEAVDNAVNSQKEKDYSNNNNNIKKASGNYCLCEFCFGVILVLCT